MIFLMGLSLFLGTTAFAEATPLVGEDTDDKFYVEPGTVHVAPNGIFLNLDGNFIPVSSVSADEEGIYVLGFDVSTVCCSRCGLHYDANEYRAVCPHERKRNKWVDVFE